MQIDQSVDLALIVAIISLISPLLTTIFNILYQLFIRWQDNKKEQYSERNKFFQELFTGYLRSVSRCVISASSDGEDYYSYYYPLILLYVSKDNQNVFIEFDRLLSKSTTAEAESKLADLTLTVQIELDRLCKLQRR